MQIARRTLLGAGLALPFSRAAFAQGARPVLRIGVAEVPPTLEPARELSNVGTRVTYSIFDTLIRRDFLGSPDGGGSGLKPHLATSWRREGPQALVLELRQGVRFHNGDLLTPADVVYTFTSNRMFGEKPLMPEARSYFATLAGVEAVGPHTVRFTTKVPDVLLEQRLASWCAWIVNKRAYEERGYDGFSLDPIGTGPYRLKALSRDQRITLEAFDEHWMGRPTAQTIEFRAMPELASRVAGLQAGDLDLITNVPPDQVQPLSRTEGIDIRSVVLANSHVLTFDARGPQMGDKRLRQALGLSIDRKLLVDTLWDGKAVVPAGHNYPEYGPMFLEGRSLRFDPAEARRLLKEAGYAGQEITYRTMPKLLHQRAQGGAGAGGDVARGGGEGEAAGGGELHPDAGRGPADRQQLELHPPARSARRAVDLLGPGVVVPEIGRLRLDGCLQCRRQGAGGGGGPGTA